MNPMQFEEKRRVEQLRKTAEAQIADAPPPEAPERSAEELLHELRVHQVELEMQNEELRRAQAALEESRDRYADLYEFAPVGYLTLSRDGMIVEINLMGSTLLGMERKQLLRSRLDAFVAPEERDLWYHQFVGMIKHEVGRQKFEVRLRRSDGYLFYARLDCLRIESRDAAPVIRIALTDIDAVKRAENLLRVSNETLEQRVREELDKNREKGLLLAQQSRLAAIGEVMQNVSHHWRQPLNTVGLILSNLKDTYEFNELTPEYLNEEVALGQQLVQEMSATIDGFRDFFASDAGKRSFRVCDKVAEAVRLLEPAFKSANIDIEIERSDEPHGALGYPGEFARAVLSILTNARDAIVKKSIPGKIRITAEKRGQVMTVSIRDNGGGVPADMLDKVFDPYFTTKECGTGFGLYLAKTIMDHMGGAIDIRNSGDGAEVLLTLPLEENEQVIPQPYS